MSRSQDNQSQDNQSQGSKSILDKDFSELTSEELVRIAKTTPEATAAALLEALRRARS